MALLRSARSPENDMMVQFNIRISYGLKHRLRVVSALRGYHSTEAFARHLLESHPDMDERLILPVLPKREKAEREKTA